MQNVQISNCMTLSQSQMISTLSLSFLIHKIGIISTAKDIFIKRLCKL